MPRPNEDAFLGSLLGLAIGDALGMPLAGLSAATIRERHGRLTEFMPLTLADGTEVPAGEFTDESELALCVVEAVSANNGVVDVDLIAPRMVHMATGDSRHWLADASAAALDHAGEHLEFRVPLDEDGPATGDVAARAVPIGLLHSVGRFHPDAMADDVRQIVSITHGSPAAVTAGIAAAAAVRLAARSETDPAGWPEEVADLLGGGAVADRLRNVGQTGHDATSLAARAESIGTGLAAEESVVCAVVLAAAAPTFEEAVVAAVNAGGAADTVGALAGAIAGARFGSAGIPQRLIDALGGRIYVSLGAPWLFRAAQHRAGQLINLRPAPPRPTMPPRY